MHTLTTEECLLVSSGEIDTISSLRAGMEVTMQKWKGCLGIFLFLLSAVFFSIPVRANTVSGSAVSVTAKSAVLLEGNTGEIITEKDKDKELVPASITKIMTLNLIFEALDEEIGRAHV